MNIQLIRNILASLLIVLAQVVVLNNIQLFSCATPLLYVYIALLFRRDFPRWAVIVWCFAVGMVIDVFSNTPGVAAAAMTLVGLLQPMVLRLFTDHDTPTDFQPDMSSLGKGTYAVYATIIVLPFCVVLFTLETFSFFNWLQWLMSVVGSCALTLVLILIIEYIRKK